MRLFEMNVLAMSISNKVPMIKAIREAMNRAHSESQLYGADASENCLGKYFVDHYWQCPPLQDLTVQLLIEYCMEHQIKVIFPSRDGELIFFATHRSLLLEYGIQVMVSNPDSVQLCLDKLQFYEQLSSEGFPAIHTSTDLDFDSQLYVVKERYGAGSMDAGIGLSCEEAERHAQQMKHPIFQPFIQGMECSIDTYIAKDLKAKGAIVRQRNWIVNGESRITTTFRDESLEQLCSVIGEHYELRGHAIFQLILDEHTLPHLIECNCRFGGASTLSIAMGLDSFYWFIFESQGFNLQDIPFIRSQHEKTLIRHAEDHII